MNNPRPIVVANIKANLSREQVSAWIDDISQTAQNFPGTIIFCPSYPFLASASQKIAQNGLKLKLGSQDISKFKEGAFTGEVSATQIADIVDFAIVGHSERKKYFGEGDDDVVNKIERLIAVQITPILCVSGLSQLETYIHKGKTITENSNKIIFVYEPPGAISGGGDYKADSPEDVNLNARKFIDKIGKETIVLYGGSLNPENTRVFFSQKNISGGLVGQASTDPATFIKLIGNAKI